jgi:hypothetical protein
MGSGGVPDLPSPRLRAAAAGRHSPLPLRQQQAIDTSAFLERKRQPSTLASTLVIPGPMLRRSMVTRLQPSLPSRTMPSSPRRTARRQPKLNNVRALELLAPSRDGSSRRSWRRAALSQVRTDRAASRSKASKRLGSRYRSGRSPDWLKRVGEYRSQVLRVRRISAARHRQGGMVSRK